jgi:hypothetical protein
MPLAKVQLMESPGGPGVTGAVKAGSGITISADGTISATSGGGGITQLTAGAGITISPNPITTTGSIANSGILTISPASSQLVVTTTSGNAQIGFQQNAVVTFDPLQGITGGNYTGRAGSGGLGSFTFGIPNGANYGVMWTRCRFTVYSTATGTEANQVAWAQDCAYSLTGSGFTITTAALANQPMLSVPSRAGRGNGTCFTRFDLISFPGGTNRSGSLNFLASVGAGPANSDWYVVIDTPQVIILPFNL